MNNQHDHGSYISNFQDNKGSELKIIMKNGSFQIIPYAHRSRTEFIPEVGIIMEFSFGRITLSGRNLAELANKIGRRKIDTVIEQHVHEREVPEDQAYIASILVEARID